MISTPFKYDKELSLTAITTSDRQQPMLFLRHFQ